MWLLVINHNRNNYNVTVGWESLNSTTTASDYNVVLGASAGYRPAYAHTSVLAGYKAFYATDQNEIVSNSVHIGAYSAENLEQSIENVGIGSHTLWGTDGVSLRYNTALGNEAGRYLGSGSNYNIITGYKSGYMRGGSSSNTFNNATSIISIGNFTALSQSILDSVILIGTDVLRDSQYADTTNNGPIEDVIFIGHSAGKNPYNDSTTTHSLNIAIGNLSQEHITNTESAYNITIGNKSLRKNRIETATGDNIVIGHEAAESASMQYSIAIGNQSQKWVYGKYNVSVGQSTFMGLDYAPDAEPSLTQSKNVFVGDEVAKYSFGLMENVAVGYQAMASSSKLSRHVAIGAYALLNADNNTGGGYSTLSSSIAIGYKALYEYPAATNNVYDGANIAIGEYSLGDAYFVKDTIAIGFEAARGAKEQTPLSDKSIAIGSYNMYNFESANSIISVGYKGLYNFNSGSDLISIGNNALYNYISGSTNVAIGNESLYTNQAGIYNIAIGYRSLYSSSAKLSNNIAIGVESQYYNFANNQPSNAVSGNISYGHYSLRNVTSGYGNIAFGYNALYGDSVLTGSVTGPLNNIAIGNNSLYNINLGKENIAVGNHALENVTSHSFNVGIGGYALNKLKLDPDDSTYNIAIGYRALSNKVSGSSDIAIGRLALNTTSSFDNVVIGNLAGVFRGTIEYDEYGGIIDRSAVSAKYNVLIGTANSFYATGSKLDGIISIGNATLQSSKIESNYTISTTNTGIIAVGGQTLQNQKTGSLTGILAIGHRTAPRDLKGSIDESLLIGNNILEFADLSTIDETIKEANVLAIGHNVARSAKFTISTQSFAEGQYYDDGSVLTAIGYNAFQFATSSTSNVGIGAYVGSYSKGKFNLFIGNSTGFDNKGDNNVVVGNESFNLGIGIIGDGIVNTPTTVLLGTRTTGSFNNTVIGNYTLRNSIATNVTSIGYNNLDTGYTQRLGESVYAGGNYYVSSVPTTSSIVTNVISIGNKIGRYAQLVTSSIFIGDFVGGDVHGLDRIIAIGNYALGAYDYETELAYVPSINDGTQVTHSNNITIGNYSSYYLKEGQYNTAIGNYAYFNAYDRIGNSLFGNESGYHLGEYERVIGESLECGTGNYNTFGGHLSGWAIGKSLNGIPIVAPYTPAALPGQAQLPTVYYVIETDDAAGTPDRNTVFGSDALPNLYNACMPFPTFTALGNSSRNSDAGGTTPPRESRNILYNFSKNNQYTNDPPAPAALLTSMITNEKGNLNVAVGYKAGFELVAGGKNVYIGAGVEGGADWENKETKDGPQEYRNGNNNIVIGYNAHKSDPIVSNEITIGNPNHEAARLVGQMGAWLYGSDARDKTDTGSFNVGLDFIKSLQPKSYKWDSRYNYASGSGSNGTYTSSNYYMGFIAQEFYQSVYDHIDPDYRAPWFNLARQIRKDNSEYYDVLEIAPTLTIIPLVNAVKQLSQYVTGSVTGSYSGSFSGSVIASDIVVDALYQKSNTVNIESLDQAVYSKTLSKMINGYTSGSNPTGSAGVLSVTTGSLVSASVTYPDLLAMSGTGNGYISATRIDSGSTTNVYRYNLVTKYENGTLSIVTSSVDTLYQSSPSWSIDFKVVSNEISFAVYGQPNTQISWANSLDFTYTNIIRRSESTGCTTCSFSEVSEFIPTNVTLSEI